jgi:hypothetical protein
MSSPGQWFRDMRGGINKPQERKGTPSAQVQLELLYSARMNQIKLWQERGFVREHPLIHAYMKADDCGVLLHEDNICDDNHWMDFAMILMAIAG